eukprot:7795680-Prorocentrum_lima.AAC.1
MPANCAQEAQRSGWMEIGWFGAEGCCGYHFVGVRGATRLLALSSCTPSALRLVDIRVTALQ